MKNHFVMRTENRSDPNPSTLEPKQCRAADGASALPPRSAGTSRREFIQKAATITAIGFAAPHLALGAATRPVRRPGPNSRIHVGLIGCGSMGRANLGNCARQPDVVVTAACDVNEARLEATVETYKPTCKGYVDFREMLQQPDLDAVIIATPPHWHCLQAIAAAEAGKDIYLQKPMTLHLGESLAVRNAIRKHGVISQIGTQIHASENYRRVVEYIRSGNLGPIGVVRTFNVMNQTPAGIGHSKNNTMPEGLHWDLWCGPAPLIPYNRLLAENAYYHGSWMAYSGGWTPGMAPHIIDLPVWALDLGYPLVTSSAGGRYVVDDDGDAYDHHEVLWQYPKLTMTWMSSLTNSYGFDLHGEPEMRRRLGIYFHGANGTMYADYNMFKIVPEGDRLEGKQPPPHSIPPSPGHEREWLDCIKSRQQPSCSVFYHVRVDVPIVLSLLSLKLRRAIRFDPDKEWIVGDPEASKLAVPTYRKPWKFPKHYLS
jgi:predicted dehydrogenase